MNTLSGRHNTLVLACLIFLALVVTAWGYLLWNPPSPKATAPAVTDKLILNAPIIGGTDPQRGAKSGDIVIVEFGDYLCPSCADMHKAITEIMQDNPRVRFVWKDMPNTRIHPTAKTAAVAARCAGAQNKFWEYHDMLFARQDDIIDSATFGLIADELKLNRTAFDACLESAAITQMVDLTIAEGVALNVDATPYFFVGKARGAFDKGDLKNALKNYTP